LTYISIEQTQFAELQFQPVLFQGPVHYSQQLILEIKKEDSSLAGSKLQTIFVLRIGFMFASG